MTINYKVFAAGDTLSANDLLTYIENQAVIQVDNEAELTTLNTTYPSVRVAFAQDTDKLYVNNDGVWDAVVSGVSPTLTNLTLTGNLTVQGTTTTIDSATIAVKDKFIFEGATADAHETTLQVAEPTADRTITLPDATGTVALTTDVTGKTDKATLDATGAMYYASSANTPAKLAIGTSAQQLRVSSGGIPEWFTPSGGGGKVLQVVQGTTSTDMTTTSTTYADTNLTASITPSLATSKVLVLVSQQCYVSGSGTSENAAKYRLVRAATTILDYNNEFIKAKSGSGTAELGLNIGISYLDSPATTSSTTYKTMGASATSGRNVQFQQSNLFPSSIVLLEIGA